MRVRTISWTLCVVAMTLWVLGVSAAPAGAVAARTEATVLLAMMSLPHFSGEHFSSEERRELYRPVAQAVAAVAQTPEETAALVAQAWHETKFASKILYGHCDQMPKGQRCDHGRALGPWQVHGWCKDAWAAAPGSVEGYEAAARCALRAMRGGLYNCSSWEGAFSATRGIASCEWEQSPRRVQTMRGVLTLLRKMGQ